MFDNEEYVVMYYYLYVSVIITNTGNIFKVYLLR